MNLVAQLLPLSNVIAELDADTKESVFGHIAQLFENNLHIASGEVLVSLLTREKLGSTSLGQGVAIPHGRIKGLGEAVAAFIRTKNPVPFGRRMDYRSL